jgi:glycosyltransferase involved in cell wall biosynthesis
VENKEKILFTATFSTSFILEDLNILRRHFYVTERISSGIKNIFLFIPSVKNNDISFSWFASVYSSAVILLTKIFQKKSILILGGVDVAKMPEFNYGIWNSRWKSVIVRYGIKNADIVLAVDPSIKQDAMTLAQFNGNNISVLPTGHDSTFWTLGETAKRNFVLTVAACDSTTRFRIKGLDFLYNVARQLPGTRFVLIGMSDSMQVQFPAPSNIEVHSYTSPDTLLEFYRQAKVYFQPSLREAFGSTICEAMLCGCYPIGTDVGGIPTVIGNSGSIVPFNDYIAAVEKIQLAMALDRTSNARERIINNFSLAQREKKLLEIISSLNDR